MADALRPDSYYDLSDIFPQATINDPSITITASAAGSIERPSAFEPVVIACSTSLRRVAMRRVTVCSQQRSFGGSQRASKGSSGSGGSGGWGWGSAPSPTSLSLALASLVLGATHRPLSAWRPGMGGGGGSQHESRPSAGLGVRLATRAHWGFGWC